MYRSFVTCNDPSGVVECRTIRKSKSASSKMDEKMERRLSQKISGESLPFKAEEEEVSSKRVVQHCHNSSFQLREVSRGAQKLNQMIDSWSKGQNRESRSKHIAKDLLKGALDLQESLIMLGKLQETTQYKAQFKKKEVKKLASSRIDEVSCERVSSGRSRDQDCQKELQKPWHSDDGSRDAVEELKKAIRDGFARQSVVSNKRNQARTRFDWKQMESASDIPSTSSSQSSVLQSNSSYSSDSYVVQAAPKEKGLNLIAKLMGLEEIPSKPSSQTLHKQSAVEKNLSQRRPNFDIEKPGVWKAQPAVKMADSEQTLKEVLETMHFKGLLRSSSARELKPGSDQSNDFHSRRRSVDNVLPIVLMKPQRALGLQSEELPEPSTWNEGDSDTKMTLRKMMVKEVLAPKLKLYKEQILSAKKIQHRTSAEVTPIKTLRQEEEEEAKDLTKGVDKQKEKEVKTVVQKERPMDASNTLKKMRAEDTAAKNIFGEEGTKDQRETVGRVGDEYVKTKLRGPPKMKSPVHNQEQRKEISGKRLPKIEKVAVTGREIAAGKTAKTRSISTLQYQDKVTSLAKAKKPEKGSAVVKNQSKHNSAPIIASKHRTLTNIHSSKEKKKKEKSGSESMAAERTIENLGCKEDGKCTDIVVGNALLPLLEENTTVLAKQISPEEGAINFIQLEEHCRDERSSLPNDLTFECKMNSRSSENTDVHIDQISRDTTICQARNPFKVLLLNSSSFLTRAEELFHLSTSYSNILQTTDICDSEPTDSKILLDYANEFIEIRSLSDTQTRHPLLTTYMETSRTVSIQQLVDEVCNGATSLGSYSNLPLNKLPADCLYAILERDMTCRGVLSGIWDLAWRRGFSAEEAEQAVNDLEKLLVSDLIEEMYT